MPKSRSDKETMLNSLVDGFSDAKSIVFVGFDGLTVEEVTELRSKCRAEDITYIVAKKTLVNLALDKNDLSVVDTKSLTGSMATVYSSQDEVTPVKLLADYAKAHEAVVLLGGIVDGAFVDQDGVQALSKLPSKQELYAQVVGSIKAPISGLVMTLSGTTRNLVGVLNAIKDKKEA